MSLVLYAGKTVLACVPVVHSYVFGRCCSIIKLEILFIYKKYVCAMLCCYGCKLVVFVDLANEIYGVINKEVYICAAYGPHNLL